jgi:hypothetical protein
MYLFHDQATQHVLFKYHLYARYPDRTGKSKKKRIILTFMGVLRDTGRANVELIG